MTDNNRTYMATPKSYYAQPLRRQEPGALTTNLVVAHLFK